MPSIQWREIKLQVRLIYPNLILGLTMVKIVKLEEIYTKINSKQIYPMNFTQQNLRLVITLIVINIVTNKISQPIINIFNVI